MCAINGFNFKDKDLIYKMNKLIDYRGPDNSGVFLDSNISLGHDRLKIIDLSSKSNQPLSIDESSLTVVFNGEIYNFKDIRENLIKKGHNFNSKGDAEVLLRAYKEYGEDCFNILNGMFSVAIWDKHEKKLILARDKYGQKPLYYFWNGDKFIFSSEIKSILIHDVVKRRLDELSLFHFFSFDYIPQPRTIFKGIKKVENGQMLILKDKNLRLKRYFELKLNTNDNLSFEEAKKKLEDELDFSIKRHLVSDAPLGVYLSGGLDSSVITYYSKKYKKDLKTFSIGFKESSFDESVYAKNVASFLKTDHYHKVFSENDFINALSDVLNKLDEPFGDPSLIPTFVLSKFAKKHVDVVLSGDGGDELFMGYPNYKVHKVLNLSRLNKLKINLNYLNYFMKKIKYSDKNLSIGFKFRRLLLSSNFNALYRDFIIIGSYSDNFKKLFNYNIKDLISFKFVDDFLNKNRSFNYFEKVILLFQKYYLSDDILFKSDRASMYNSLELRAPFLDNDLSSFVNSMPLKFKLNRLKEKYILKKIMKDKLPDNILKRSKKGFGVPLASWLRGGLRNYMEEALSEENFKNIEFINYKEVKVLMNRHLSGKEDNRKILWNLIVFQNWYKNYFIKKYE